MINTNRRTREVDIERSQAAIIRAYEGRGDINNLIGVYKDAIRDYESAISLAGNDISVIFKIQQKIAEVYRNQGDFKKGLKLLNESSKFLTGNEIDFLYGTAEIGISRSWIHRIEGKITKAVNSGNYALKIAKKLLNSSFKKSFAKLLDKNKVKKLIGKAHNNLGVIFWSNGNYNRAIEHFKKNLEISSKIGDKHATGIALGNLGIAYYAKGDYRRASASFMSSLKIFEEISDKQRIGTACGNLGNIYLDKGEYDRAIALHGRNLNISKQIGNKSEIARASGNLGLVYYYKGDFKRAIELNQRDLRISREIGHRHGIGRAANNLALINIEKGYYKQAIKFAKMQLDIVVNTGEREGEGTAYSSLGAALLELGNIRQARKYLLRAEKIFRKIEHKEQLLSVYLCMANLRLKEGDIEQALDYSKKGLRMAYALGLKSYRANFLTIFGLIFCELGHFRKAAKNFQNAIKLFEELDQKKLIADVYYGYAKLLHKGFEVGYYSVDKSKKYFKRALKIYQELKLKNKIKEIEILHIR